MTRVTNGMQAVDPLLWMDYESTRESRTTAHTLMNGQTALTVRPHAERRVTVVLLFDDEMESKRCEDIHAAPQIITITEDGRDTHSMRYAVIGQVSRELDPETASVWIVSAEVIEVFG